MISFCSIRILTLVSTLYIATTTTTITPALAAKFKPSSLNICYKNFNLSSETDSEPANHLPKCYYLYKPECLDIVLPYSNIALPSNLLDFNISSIEDVPGFLQKLEVVKELPKCWPLLQVALCSIFMPQCKEDPVTKKITHVATSSQDICIDLINKGDCHNALLRYIPSLLHSWPSIFNCNDTNLYSKNCTSELRDPKLQRTQHICPYPLVATNDSSQSFSDIPGCALSCKFPISNQDELYNINFLIRFSWIDAVISLAGVILILANESKALKSPIAKVVKRYNICQFFIYLGWSLQIIYNENIACAPDGTNLVSLPLTANACVLSFILTHLPSLYCTYYFACLGKLCHEKLQGSERRSLKSPKENGDAIDSYLHLLLAAIFVVVAFVIDIDGNGLYGVGTIGRQSKWIKIGFEFFTLIGVCYGNFYFLRAAYKLMRAENLKPSLFRYSLRINFLWILGLMEAVFSIGIYLYELHQRPYWVTAIVSYITCNLDFKANLDEDGGLRAQNCSIDSKPAVAIYYFYIFSRISIGLVVASWAFSESNYRGLCDKLVQYFEDEKDKKRRAIAYLKQLDAYNRENLLHDYANEFRGSNHHLVDLPSVTPQNLELNEKCRSTPTPSSVSSTNLQPYMSSHAQRRNSRILNAGPTSRDVIESQRQQVLQNGFTAPPIAALPPLTTNPMDLNQLLMFQFLENFRTNLNINQEFYQPATEPDQFVHGLSGTDYKPNVEMS